MVQINELIKNEEQLKIIQYFIDHPTKEITQKELQKLKLAKGTIVKWLDFLDKKEIIHFRNIGLNKLYKLNNKDLFVKQLKVLNIVLILEDIKKLKKECEIYLYGSYARGDYIEDSDIDILIIGKINKNEVINTIDPISKKVNRKINFQIFSSIEWSKMARNDPSFYERVEKDKIRLK